MTKPKTIWINVEAVLVTYNGNEPVKVETQKTFDTQEEAEQYGIKIAKEVIDRMGCNLH